jgi:hypothetical protein
MLARRVLGKRPCSDRWKFGESQRRKFFNVRGGDSSAVPRSPFVTILSELNKLFEGLVELKNVEKCSTFFEDIALQSGVPTSIRYSSESGARKCSSLENSIFEKEGDCAGDIAIRLRVLIPRHRMHYLELHRLAYGKQAKSSIIL